MGVGVKEGGGRGGGVAQLGNRAFTNTTARRALNGFLLVCDCMVCAREARGFLGTAAQRQLGNSVPFVCSIYVIIIVYTHNTTKSDLRQARANRTRQRRSF